jgi:alcohol dehydrogenase (NADP+)
MSTKVAAIAAFDTSGTLKRHVIERRVLLDTDVDIEIKFCGVCHSDLHLIRCEWPGPTHYPMVIIQSFHPMKYGY